MDYGRRSFLESVLVLGAGYIGSRIQPNRNQLDQLSYEGVMNNPLNPKLVMALRMLVGEGHLKEKAREEILYADIENYDGPLNEVLLPIKYVSRRDFLRRFKTIDPDQVAILNGFNGIHEIPNDSFIKLPFRWEPHNNIFLRNFVGLNLKIFEGIYGSPSEELIEWLGTRYHLLPVYPTFTDSENTTAGMLGFSIGPTDGNPFYDPGVYVDFNVKNNVNPLRTLTHELMHQYIGLRRTQRLEQLGYQPHAHDLIDVGMRAINHFVYGYVYRDNRMLMAGSYIEPIEIVSTSNSGTIPTSREFEPLAYDYFYGGFSNIRDIIDSVS